MFKRICIIFFALFFSNFLSAQDKPALTLENGSNLNVLYRNESMGKIYANSRGLGVLYRRGRHVTAKSRSFYEIDFQEAH